MRFYCESRKTFQSGKIPVLPVTKKISKHTSFCKAAVQQSKDQIPHTAESGAT